jgi:hypothetical protein
MLIYSVEQEGDLYTKVYFHSYNAKQLKYICSTKLRYFVQDNLGILFKTGHHTKQIKSKIVSLDLFNQNILVSQFELNET